MKFLSCNKYVETMYGDSKVYCPICNGEGFVDKSTISFLFELMAAKGKKSFKLKYEPIRNIIWKGKELESRKEIRQTDIYFKGEDPMIPILIDKVRVYEKGYIGHQPDGHTQTKFFLIDGSHRLLNAIDNTEDPNTKVIKGIRHLLTEVWGTHHDNFLMHPEKHDETHKSIREQYPDTHKAFGEDAIVQIHHKKAAEYINIPWSDPVAWGMMPFKMWSGKLHDILAREKEIEVKIKVERTEIGHDHFTLQGFFTKDKKFVKVMEPNKEEEVKEAKK